MAGTYDDLLKSLFSLTRKTTKPSNIRHSPSVSEDIFEDGDDNFLDDCENDYEDHTTETSDIEIDNSNLSYVGKNICMKNLPKRAMERRKKRRNEVKRNEQIL